MTLPTIRSTVGRTLLPATVLYGVALLWSDAEGIRANLVLRDLAQSCDAPLGQGFLSSLVISSRWRQRRLRCLR